MAGDDLSYQILLAAAAAKLGAKAGVNLPALGVQQTYDVLRPLLQNSYRGYVGDSSTQPATQEQVRTHDYDTGCDMPDVLPHQVLVPYATPAMRDDLGQVIEGGPQARDDILYQDLSGQSSTTAFGTMGSQGRRLPFISDVLKGDGMTQDYYGDKAYTSPDSGQAVAGIGRKDRRVRKPTLRVLAGEGFMFSTTPPSLVDPAQGGTPPSTDPRPGDPPDKYVTLDLLTIGGVLMAGLTKTGGDDGNGVGLVLDAHSGLQVLANKLSILPDGTSTWIDPATGQLKAGAAAGQPAIAYDPGPGIEFTQAPDTATPGAALSVQAQAGAGLLPGVYSYGFAWQTDLGSTTPSPLATGTADTSNGQMVLTLPPVPTNLTALGVGSITGAVLLRTKAGGTDLYTLATEDIVSGTAPSPYTDILPDSGLTTIYQPDHVIASHLAFSDANRTVPASGLSRTAGQDKKGEAINLASVSGHLAAGLILTGGDDHNGLRLYEAMIAGARAGTLDWAVGDDGNGAAVRRDDITIGKNSADQLVAKAITSPSGSTDPVGTSNNPWGCGPNAWTPSGTTGEGPVATTTSSSTTGGLATSPTTPPASGSYSPSTSTSPPGPGYNCAGNAPARTNYSSLTFVEADVAKYSIKTGSGFTLKSQTSDPDHGSLRVPTGAGGHNGSGFWLQYQVTVLNDVVDPQTGYTGIAAQDMDYGTGASFQLVWLPLDHQWHILDGFAPGGGSIPAMQPGRTAYVAWYGDCQGYMHLLVGSSASSFTEIYKGNFAPTTGVTFGFGASGCYSSGFPRTSTSPVQDEFRISSIYCSDGVPPGTVIANFNGTSNTFSGTPGTMDANGVPITPLMGAMPFAPAEALPPILTGAFPAGETFGVTIDSTTDPSYDPATVSDLQAQASAACSGCSATGAPFYTCSGVVSGGDVYAPSLTGDHIHALKDFLDDGNMLVKGKGEIDGTLLLKSDVEIQGKFYDGDGNLYGVTSLDDSAGHKAVGDVQIILDSTSGLTGLVDPAANTYTIKGTAPGTGGGGTGGTTGGSGTGSVGSGGTSGGVGAGSGGTAQTTCTVTYDASQVVQCGSPPLPVDSYGALCTYNASTCGFVDSHGAAHDPSAPFPGGSTPSGTVPIAQCPQVTPVYAQGTGKTYYQWQGATGSVATGGSTASGPSTVVNSLNGLVGDLGVYVQNGLTLALAGTSLVLGNARPGYIGGPFHVSTDSTHGTGRLDVDGPAWFAQDVVASGGHLILRPPSAPLMAPTVNTAPGTELGVGTYLYGFTETIGGVEGSLSPVAVLVTAANNQRGVVSLQASGSTVTSRTIYRTPVNQTGPMGVVGTVPGNGATSWADQVIDAGLGAAPPGPATIAVLDDAGLSGGSDPAPVRHIHVAIDGDGLWLPAFRHGFAGLGGLMADPTTTRGDMIARGANGLVRVPVGAAGTVLLGGTDPGYGQVTDADVSPAAAISLAKLGQSGASTNMVAAWNGTAWAPLSTSGVVGSGLVAATTTQLGGVLVDRNPVSGSPVALTQYGILRHPTATTAAPLLPFGDAPFDGVTAGYFVGRGGGTMLGMNFLPPSATYAGTVLALSNLVAYWRLAETSGAVASDYSGNGHAASYGSGVTLGLPGATADNDLSASYPTDLGGGGHGLLDYASPASGIPTGSAARSFIWHWKGAYQGQQHTWIAYGTWTGGLTAFFFEQGLTSASVQLTTGANTDGAYSWSVPAIYDGAFHQFILSYDPTTSLMTLYVDGVSRGTQNVGTLATGVTDFSMGWPYYHSVCLGNYDEIVVRSGITTASEASSLYSAALQSGAFGVLDVQQRGISRWSFDSTGNQFMAGTLSIARQIISTLPTGVAPLSIQSQTSVTNLNADMVDGVHASGFQPAGAAAGGDLTGTYPNPTLAQGTISGKISQAGTLAARPAAAAGNAGDTYFATDALVLYRSSGSTWAPVSVLGTGAVLPTPTADYIGTLFFRSGDSTLWRCNSSPAWVQVTTSTPKRWSILTDGQSNIIYADGDVIDVSY